MTIEEFDGKLEELAKQFKKKDFLNSLILVLFTAILYKNLELILAGVIEPVTIILLIVSIVIVVFYIHEISKTSKAFTKALSMTVHKYFEEIEKKEQK